MDGAVEVHDGEQREDGVEAGGSGRYEMAKKLEYVERLALAAKVHEMPFTNAPRGERASSTTSTR